MDNKKNSENNNKKNNRRLPGRTNLVIHIVLGVYLLYLAYSIFNNPGEANRAVIMIFPVLFCIIGAGLIFSSLRSLQRGEYEGGAADPEKNSGKNEEEDKDAEETESTADR